MFTPAQQRTLEQLTADSRRLGLLGNEEPQPHLLGRLAAAYARYGMMRGRSNKQALAHVEQLRDDVTLRAAIGATDSTSAASLLATEVGAVIAELAVVTPLLGLRATELGMTPSSTARSHPRVGTGMVGGFIPEGGALPASAATFDALLVPSLQKWGALIAFTEQLARSPVAEAAIQALFVRAMSNTLNAASLTDAAAGTSPPGLFNTANADTAITSVDLPTDVNAVASAIADNYALNECAWILAPSTLLKIAGHKTSGVPTFPLAGERQLLGARVIESSDAEADRVALVHEPSVWRTVLVDPSQVELSSDASVHMNSVPSADLGGAGNPSPVMSAFQRSLLIGRCFGAAQWLTERPEAIQHAVVGW